MLPEDLKPNYYRYSNYSIAAVITWAILGNLAVELGRPQAIAIVGALMAIQSNRVNEIMAA